MLLRLATLAIALTAAVASTASAQAQSDATTVDAQKIEGVSDLEMSARGAAEIRHGDVGVFGEFLRYNREFGEIEGQGGVRLQSGVDRFFGPALYYNLLDDTGTFQQPQFQLQGERPARGSAERIEFTGKSKYRLFAARFTTCKPGQDDWFLEARELDLDYEADEGRADHPRLRFFDHTLLAFPRASFPLESRRRSGLLTPYYSQTSQRGLEFGIPTTGISPPSATPRSRRSTWRGAGSSSRTTCATCSRSTSASCATSTCPTTRSLAARAPGCRGCIRRTSRPASSGRWTTTRFRTNATSSISRAR